MKFLKRYIMAILVIGIMCLGVNVNVFAYHGTPKPGEHPDKYEPNDNPIFWGEGTKLDTSNITISDATMSNPYDVDEYRIYLEKSGDLKVKLTGIYMDCGLDLHDANGNFVKRSDVNGTNAEEIDISNTQAGYYWVGVWTHTEYSDIPYVLTISSEANKSAVAPSVINTPTPKPTPKASPTPTAVAVVTNPPIVKCYSINMQNAHSGSKLIYSDNPEYLYKDDVQWVNGANGHFTIDAKLNCWNDYDIEYYQVNRSCKTLKIGVALVNYNTKSTYVTLKKAVSTTTTVGSNDGRKKCAENVQLPYWNSSDASTNTPVKAATKGPNGLIIPSVTVIKATIVDGGTYVNGKVKGGTFINGKVKIYVPGTATNLNCRVFFMKSTCPDSEISKLDQASQYGTQQTTTYLPNDSINVGIDYNTMSPTKSFYIGYTTDGYRSNNPGEYQAPYSYIGSPILLGNYGVQYNIQLFNAVGKKVKVTPYWGTQNTTTQYMVYNAGNGWKPQPISVGSSFIITPIAQNIKYVLPGGSCGQVYFEIL